MKNIRDKVPNITTVSQTVVKYNLNNIFYKEFTPFNFHSHEWNKLIKYKIIKINKY